MPPIDLFSDPWPYPARAPDHALWLALTHALRDSPPVLEALHALRCTGLHFTNPHHPPYRLIPDLGDDGGFTTTDEWERARQQWLLPYGRILQTALQALATHPGPSLGSPSFHEASPPPEKKMFRS